MSKKTNLLKAVRTIKAKYNNAIALIREGDQYLAFHDDAFLIEEKAGIVTQDSRHGKVCRVSVYCLDIVLNALIKSGYRVAVVDPL